MKTSLRILLVATAAMLLVGTPRENIRAQHASVSFQVFYDDLAPYGHWVMHPTMGYVWLPIVEPDFVPYASRGHWVWTMYGWAWVSEYAWGWAPFHYGRWDYDDDYGWFWVPDVEWGPAWVVWNRYPGYYGWAPMRPGILIAIVIGGGYHPPHHWWTFCHDKYFGRRRIRNHYVPRSENGRILGESRVIENTYNEGGRSKYLSGPDKGDVTAVTGRAVNPVTINDNPSPGEKLSGRSWSVYRPTVERAAAGAPQPMPTKVETTKEAAPPTRGQANRPAQTTAPSAPNVPRSPAPLPVPDYKPGKERTTQPPPSTPRAPRTTPAPTKQPPPAQTPKGPAMPRSNPPAQTPRTNAPAQTPRSNPPAQTPSQTPKQDGGRSRQIENTTPDDGGK